MTILVHGFWGQPSDWNAVLESLPLGEEVLTPDLYDPEILGGPQVPLANWPAHFWHWVNECHGADQPVALVGYSMGARLLLHAATAAPQRVSRALFLSGNPWPPETPAKVAEREEWEARWAQDFLTKDWTQLQLNWQEQAVFKGTTAKPRRTTPEMRQALGLSLMQWSPRLQRFTADDIAALPAHLEWAFGALDQKYNVLAKSLHDLPVQGQISLIEGAGHRLITDGAEFISQWISQ